MKICIITTLVSDPRTSIDGVGNFEKFGNYDFYLFTNLKTFKHDTWNVIYLDDDMLNKVSKIETTSEEILNTTIKNNVYKSRYIKFMGWSYIKDVMKKEYDVIFYCDAIYSPNNKMNWEEDAKKIKNCESGLMQKLHPLKSDPYSEARLCIRCHKHSKENGDAIIKYLQDVGAKNERIYENTTFGYDPNNEKITNAYSDFWHIYSTHKHTYRDQPLWGWMCQKHKIKAINSPNIHTNVIHKITPSNTTHLFNFTGKNFNRSRTYKHLM